MLTNICKVSVAGSGTQVLTLFLDNSVRYASGLCDGNVENKMLTLPSTTHQRICDGAAWAVESGEITWLISTSGLGFS